VNVPKDGNEGPVLGVVTLTLKVTGIDGLLLSDLDDLRISFALVLVGTNRVEQHDEADSQQEGNDRCDDEMTFRLTDPLVETIKPVR
jgi:hypothetical protein